MSPIPVLSARTVGIFRVVFGASMFAILLGDPPVAQPIELHRNYSWLADWGWVHALASSPAACRVLHFVTLALAAAFAVGLWTRTAFVGLFAGILVGRLVTLQHSGTHNWDLPLLTLAVLTIVPWGDGFSIDARLRRPASTTASAKSGRLYGLAIWIPGFMLGLALAGAAYAKLTNGGLAWFTSGPVRFHFVEDAANAPVDWGLWVAAHPAVAIVLSAAGLMLEACFIAASVKSSLWWRLLWGTAGLSLYAGFYLFQGIVWWPWLLLFTAFLPWPLLDRERPAIATAHVRPWHAFVLLGVACQQIAVSVSGTEIEPLFSNYAMYSGAYSSVEEFERVRYRKLQRLIFESDGRDITERIEAISNGPENLLNAAEAAATADESSPELIEAVRGIRLEYRTRYGDDLGMVLVKADRIAFDWERGRFNPASRVTIGEVVMPPVLSEAEPPSRRPPA
jgi:hypothetical protein